MPSETLHACPTCASSVARSLIPKHQAWHDDMDVTLETPVVTEASSIDLQPGWPTDLNTVG